MCVCVCIRCSHHDRLKQKRGFVSWSFLLYFSFVFFSLKLQGFLTLVHVFCLLVLATYWDYEHCRSRVSPSLVYVISYWSNLEIFSDQPVHCTQIIKKIALFRYEITRKMVAFHINYHLLFGSWLWTSMFTVFLFFLLEIWIILCTEIFKKSRLTLTWLLSACLPSLSPLIDLIYEHFLLQ